MCPVKIITWNITQSCNFRCDYCIDSGDGKLLEKDRIDEGVIEEAFDKLGRDWIILITGGEPFIKINFIAVNTNLSTKSVY